MPKFKVLLKEEAKKLPKKSGVYAFKRGREILYIGKAANIKERVKNHFQQPSFKESIFLNKTKKIGFIKTDSEIEALILEAKLIKKYQPKYNVVWRDDKNYFYVGITKEGFPRIFWTHQPKREVESKKYKVRSKKKRKKIFKPSDFGLQTSYVGPFVDGKALKQTLKVLRKVFPYRSCKKIPNRPCLWYHLGRCPGPCLLKSAKIPLQDSSGGKAEFEGFFYKRIKNEGQRNAKNIIKILRGKKIQVLRNLKKKMKIATKKQDFEEAAKIRDQINSLEKIIENAKIFEPQIEKLSWPDVEKKLKRILKTENKISRIEAYDVSNISGKLATGAMVTFIEGLARKDFYRKFKIKFTERPNDILMIKEVLSRRFKHLEWGWPDLILIDGGIAQLNAGLKVKKQRAKAKSIRVLALAKKRNKIYIEGRKKPLLLKNLPREIFNLILQLRDEAHRFAFTYHRKLRERDIFK